MHEKILSLLIDRDEITWQSIIHDLVKSGEINPWDVNITELTKKYIIIVKKLKEADLRVSGKVVLAAALLLRMKSSKLLDEDINEFDRLLASTEEMSEDEFYDDLENDASAGASHQFDDKEDFVLTPRTPLPRKRKVSIYDLIESLEKAFHVKQRRVIRNTPMTTFKVPQKSSDMTLVIRSMYKQITDFFKKGTSEDLTFNMLLPSESKVDKVYTFIPLLHLTNQRRIDLHQASHFGDISIQLLKNERVEEVEAEMGSASAL
jgi:segregation and condensation protein A